MSPVAPKTPIVTSPLDHLALASSKNTLGHLGDAHLKYSFGEQRVELTLVTYG